MIEEKDRGYNMLTAVVNSGEAEAVMNAARSAGANGGTVISANGTGSPGSKKDIVIILSSAASTQRILEAISTELDSDGKGIAFSLPVDDVVGIITG